MSKRIVFVLICTIFWMMFSVPVMAVSIVELPVITKWENGNGYDEKGNRLEDTMGRMILSMKQEDMSCLGRMEKC